MDYPVSDPGSQLHNGKLTDGDAGQGVDPSIDKANHMNALYDELLAFITAMGLTPDENDLTQVLQAMRIAAPKSRITFHYINLAQPDPVPGWLLCDGTNGTPDLTDRFIVCSGAQDPGDTGGATTKTTTSNGSHSHPITVDNHTLSESQMPSHGHDLTGNLVAGSGDTEGGSGRYSSSGTDTDVIQNTGGSAPHSHTASSSSAGNHSHTVDVRPKYFVLAPFLLASYVAELNA